MNFLQSVRASISSEIKQDQNLQKNLVLKVLSSKRLLVDHVETIVDLPGYSLNDLVKSQQASNNHITFLKTAGLLSTSYVVFIHFKNSYLIPAVTGVMPIAYIQKLVNIKKHEGVEEKLSHFIVSLDNYETAIKKNKIFLNEAQVIKSSFNVLKRYDKDNKIPQNLVESIKTVINALSNFVKDLEAYSINEEMDIVYEPFEDLQDCELMMMSLEQAADLKFIKDFFNLFAYVQSQLLLRFTLITISNVHESKKILNQNLSGLTNIVEAETSNISKFLDIINSVSQQQTSIQRQLDNEISMTMPKELRDVRGGSIKFSTKILTLALQCHHLEDLMIKFAAKYEHPDNKEVEEILSAMKMIENEMSVSIDEHKRISISFQKYLNIETDDQRISQETLNEAESQTGNENIKTINGDHFVAQVDDFFFVDGNADGLDDKVKLSEPETIEEVNSKLAKKYFKPVLVQLKERIETIGEDMKERERKVLKAKGIELEYEPEVGQEVAFDDDDGSGSDDERERKMKFERNQEKFRGNREFLESKQPINIFGSAGFPMPLQSQALNEDVLE